MHSGVRRRAALCIFAGTNLQKYAGNVRHTRNYVEGTQRYGVNIAKLNV